MPLSEQDQLSIIQDILKNHQYDCCSTVAEYQQMQRLIQSLMGHDGLSAELKNTLMDVYSYSQHGQNSSNMNDHINEHQGDLTSWINSIDDFNMT
ncbi:YtzH-like family protein [Bacillus sp. Marseille-P3661]|uniref:YtzH-like family protein n=1 Tax=Bacillus sp. Marseille-P3661 TaxID=1936234 RepID=UPI000C84F0F5|nr:YtzH-like family protein [Bacillus sp. Marseille-P3661]